VLLDLISDKARSQIVGERLIQSVLRSEEKKAEYQSRTKRVQTGKVINNYLRYMNLKKIS
jgi:hypothetical protein